MPKQLSPAQQRFMDRLAEYGYVSQGGGRRYSTAKALEKLGLIRQQVEVHHKWFGGYQPVRAGQYHREWVAYPRKSE